MTARIFVELICLIVLPFCVFDQESMINETTSDAMTLHPLETGSKNAHMCAVNGASKSAFSLFAQDSLAMKDPAPAAAPIKVTGAKKDLKLAPTKPVAGTKDESSLVRFRWVMGWARVPYGQSLSRFRVTQSVVCPQSKWVLNNPPCSIFMLTCGCSSKRNVASHVVR